MTAEEWRPVVSHPDYEVSNLGRVLSRKGREPLVMRGYLLGDYRVMTLRTDGVRRIRTVHSLVAEAFIGPRPDGLEIRHLNGDPLNNAVTNLRYGTHADNMQDRLAHGRHPMVNKTHCPKRHPYSPDNTYMQRGSRVCRTCKRDRRTRQAFRAAGIAA